MCGGLCGKRTSTLTAINYSRLTVQSTVNVDRTPLVVDPKAVKNRDFCLPQSHSTPPFGAPRRNIAMTFGMEKLEWRAWLPECGKILKIRLFVSTEYTNVTDGRTDRRTDGHQATA